MQILDLSDERLPTGSQLISKDVELTPAGGPETIEVYGFDREAFGITRILVSAFLDGTQLQGQEASAVEITAKNRTGRDTVFENVLAQSLQSLFQYRALQVPEVIDRNQSLQLEVAAKAVAGIPDTTDFRVTITLVGLNEEQLAGRRESIESQLGFMPERSWVYVPATEVPAGREKYPVELTTDPEGGFFRSFAASNAELSVNSAVRLETEDKNLAPSIRLDVLEDQFLTLPSPYTYEYRAFAPLYAEFSNFANSPVEHSFLADALNSKVLEAVGGLPGTRQSSSAERL